jgi:glycolate oxidase iron-sulfur subunit
MLPSASHKNPDRCMKCGFCLSPCPVYAIDHVENHAPRGRNILVQRVNKNLLSAEESSFQESLDYCLVCARCNAVCPAKLSSGEITQAARARLFETSARYKEKRTENQKLLDTRSSALMAKYHFSVHEANAFRVKPPQGVPLKGIIAAFPGCVFSFALEEIRTSIVYSLAATGYEVVCPKETNCCGQEFWLMGDLETARMAARQNIDALSDYDIVVTGCASCGAALKNYKNWFDDGDPGQAAAAAFSSKIFDYSEFLVKERYALEGSSSKPVKVTYHDPCYLKYSQNIAAEPRAILSSIKGIEFIEMEMSDACCGEGLAGSAQAGMAAVMLANKIESIKKTGAELVVTSCSGCILNISEGLKKEGSLIRVLHISQLFGSLDISGGRNE